VDKALDIARGQAVEKLIHGVSTFPSTAPRRDLPLKIAIFAANIPNPHP